MQRPKFDSIKDYAEFSKYYWYRDELIKICKAHGLKADGGKIELNKVVEAYFSGEKILPEKKKSTKTHKATVTELTLNTGLIECGFTFGNRFREFFKQQTGEENFKFNVDMVATDKVVKESGDESFTLGDLLDIYYGKKTYATYDKSALQWNKFVKDFCEDEATKVFPERLKAAAALWKIVRESDMKKEYSHDLLEKFKFNVDMVASVKAVKECGDESFTLGDLLDIYYGKKTYATYDKSALQWNKFVKDFCEDDATKVFSERLKAAAALWKIVRESDMKKEYTHELFEAEYENIARE